MLAEWERQHPGRLETIANSLRNVVTSHLADPKVFPFDQLELRRLMTGAGVEIEADDLAALAE
jgi:tRNA 2-thiocytidine biosynthesis protein TtcA